MASFNELFESDISFSHSDYRALPQNRAIWSDAIYNFFGDSIKLPENTPLELKFFNSTDDESIVLGGMQAEIAGRKVIFPFLVKNNKISPFDLFLVPQEGKVGADGDAPEADKKLTAYPALPEYLEKLRSSQPLGEVRKREDGTGQTARSNKVQVGGVFVGSSMPEVMRIMEETKLASLFKSEPGLADAYYHTPLGETLNSVIGRSRELRKQAAAAPADRILSVVADPVSKGTFAVGILKTSGYTEVKLSAVEAEKLYPAEVSVVVKKAARHDSSGSSETLDQIQNSDTAIGSSGGRPQVVEGKDAEQYVMNGPLARDGNVIDWGGERLNYNIVLSKTLERLTEGQIKPPCQVVFTDPESGRTTPPLFVTRKMVINNQTVFYGQDIFRRKVHILVDPDIHFIFEETRTPERAVRMPKSWELRVIPTSERNIYKALMDKTASLSLDDQMTACDTAKSLSALDKLASLSGAPAARGMLSVDFTPRLQTYTIAGTPGGVHDGSGYSWVKAACILNHYVGERFRGFRGNIGRVEYTVPPVVKTAARPHLKGDPVFIREAPKIAAAAARFKDAPPHDHLKRAYAAFMGLRLPDDYRTKYAALVPEKDAPDTLLNFNNLTPNVIEDAYKDLPKLESVIQYLSDLLLTARMTDSLPEEDIKRAIQYCSKVLQAIRQATAERTGVLEDQLAI